MKNNKFLGRLPVRDGVETVEYRRKPTPYEVRIGEGVPHYRVFSVAECCHPGTRYLKRWFIADDGLRYYR